MLPLQSQITGRSRLGLEMVLIAVGAVLLIACVNIANLLLARTTVRTREIAIRAALGASAARLLRQALVESLALALAGGALGLAVAYWATRVIVLQAPADLPRLDEVQLDTRVLLFTAGVSVFCGLLFGLLPAWVAARQDPQEAMKAAGRGSTSSKSSGRLRWVLIGGEACLSAMSLLAGALLLHSFMNLLGVDKGFSVQRLITTDLSLPAVRYPDQRAKTAFLKRLLTRVQALPGIVSAGVVNRLPLSGEGGNNVIQTEGSNLPMMQRPLADIRQVNGDYFRTMSIPIEQGASFSDADEGRTLAVVSASAARKLWPHEDPIGKRLRMGGDNNPMLQVIAVVGDVRGAGLNAPPAPTVYIPYWIRVWGSPSLVVRTSLSRAAARRQLGQVIRQLDS